jgi:heterodisulfide reductase subunit C
MDSYAESQAKGQRVTQGRQTLADSVNNPAIKKAIMAGNEDVIKKVREEQVKQEFAEPKKPESRNVKSQKMDDGSVVMYDGNTGDVIQTIKPDTPEKQQGQVQLIDKLVFQENRAQQLIDEASGWDTGLTGGVLSMVPGTDAYDRDAKIVNLKSNLGFDQIEEMKKQAAEYGASGTGLGQISNIEFLSLQSTVDTLRVGMSEEAQKEALENIKEHLSNIRLITSGVAPKDTVKWNSPDYKERGYAQDPETGKVFFAPDGPQGSRYELINGKLVKMRAF